MLSLAHWRLPAILWDRVISWLPQNHSNLKELPQQPPPPPSPYVVSWELPCGTLYQDPGSFRPATFVANEVDLSDLRWWRSIFESRGYLSEQCRFIGEKLIYNDNWNFQMWGRLTPLASSLGLLEEREPEFRRIWKLLTSSARKTIEFHPANFWQFKWVEGGAPFGYVPGLTRHDIASSTPWEKVWPNFREQAERPLEQHLIPRRELPHLPYQDRIMNELLPRKDQSTVLCAQGRQDSGNLHLSHPRLVTPEVTRTAEGGVLRRFPYPLSPQNNFYWIFVAGALLSPGAPAARKAWLDEYLDLICWVSDQDMELWTDFLPPQFVWEPPIVEENSLPQKIFVGLSVLRRDLEREEAIRALTLYWARFLSYSLLSLDQAERVLPLMLDLLRNPTEPKSARERWRALER